MVELNDTLKKKVHWLIAAGVIVVITLAAAWMLSARAASSLNFGGRITYYQPKCILDSPVTNPTTCAISCPACSKQYGPACTGMEEIDFTPYGGNSRGFVCPIKGFLYKGGKPQIGGQILGNGTIESAIIQTGVSR